MQKVSLLIVIVAVRLAAARRPMQLLVAAAPAAGGKWRNLSLGLALTLATLVAGTVAALPAPASAATSALAPETLTRARVIRAETNARYRLMPGRKLVVTEATSTGVVESLTLLTDPLEPLRVVPADNGIYFAICSARAKVPLPGAIRGMARSRIPAPPPGARARAPHLPGDVREPRRRRAPNRRAGLGRLRAGRPPRKHRRTGAARPARQPSDNRRNRAPGRCRPAHPPSPLPSASHPPASARHDLRGAPIRAMRRNALAATRRAFAAAAPG